jgi:hypothetical protein
VVRLFPIFFSEEDGRRIGMDVTLEEVEYVLRIFSKSKSLGTDGWKMDFILGFLNSWQRLS